MRLLLFRRTNNEWRLYKPPERSDSVSGRQRPKIVVERLYVGDKPMEQVFQKLAEGQIQRKLQQKTVSKEQKNC